MKSDTKITENEKKEKTETTAENEKKKKYSAMN